MTGADRVLLFAVLLLDLVLWAIVILVLVR